MSQKWALTEVGKLEQEGSQKEASRPQQHEEEDLVNYAIQQSLQQKKGPQQESRIDNDLEEVLRMSEQEALNS